MTYYLLPSSQLTLFNQIGLKFNDEIPDIYLSHSLSNYLNEIKEKITNNELNWDNTKRYTNPYEYIHTLIPEKKKCISRYKPLSRSYFKMVEMTHLFKLLENYSQPPINTFHLAEGPGGFIEAILNIRNNPNDTYYGMTIIDNKHDDNIPSWKKSQSFLRNHSNVVIENGSTKTGDLLDLRNFESNYVKYKHSMDIITADGGFDFSENFNLQEINIHRLLFAQICHAIIMQNYKGSFILKLFDCFRIATVDILYILSSLYEKVYIVKPHTSRYGNSEKYVVCKYFRYNKQYNSNILHQLYQKLHQAMSDMGNNKTQYIHRFVKIDISSFFLNKIQEYNAIFGQQQLENIAYTLTLLKDFTEDKKHSLVRNNIIKCIHWCEKYNVSFNNIPGILVR
jgi:23S rRNA U2552 (ribose-2'-O)-methylase RlmE/FtsJ